MIMEPCNGGDPQNGFLLPFYEWDELNAEQKMEIRRSIGQWLGTDVVKYRFAKGKQGGQQVWFAHEITEKNVSPRPGNF